MIAYCPRDKDVRPHLSDLADYKGFRGTKDRAQRLRKAARFETRRWICDAVAADNPNRPGE